MGFKAKHREMAFAHAFGEALERPLVAPEFVPSATAGSPRPYYSREGRISNPFRRRLESAATPCKRTTERNSNRQKSANYAFTQTSFPFPRPCISNSEIPRLETYLTTAESIFAAGLIAKKRRPDQFRRPERPTGAEGPSSLSRSAFLASTAASTGLLRRTVCVHLCSSVVPAPFGPGNSSVSRIVIPSPNPAITQGPEGAPL